MKTLDGLAVDFPTLGFAAASWIETYCVHGPGDVAGEPVELTDEDVVFLCFAYRLDPETGRRLITDADLSAPKGWAKSELAGFVALWEAFGPCRFDHWALGGEHTDWGHVAEAGEPIGRRVMSPFVRCLATEEDQSGNTYRNVLYTLEHGERIAEDYAFDAGLTRTLIKEPGGGEIRPSTSGDASKDGGLESFIVADETHLYVLLGLKEMYRTVERNGRKRKNAQPWILRTTTSFAPGEESIAEQMWAVFESVDCDPVRAITELGLLVDHREAPEDLDITDDEALAAALEYVYGEKAAFVDIPAMIRVEFRRPGADIPNARRYFLNQRVKASGRWMSANRYDARRAGTGVTLQAGDKIALGFDGSRTTDATAFVGCRLHDGLLDPLGYWERPPKLPRWKEWAVPDAEVHDRLEWIMDTFVVVRFYADPHWWRQELDTWHGRWPGIVVRYDTSKPSRMVPAVDRMATDIDSGAVQFSDDETLRRQFLNAYAVKSRIELERGRFGVTLAKETRDSRDLIDQCMAAILANAAKGDAIADGALEEDEDAALYTF